MLGKKIFKGIKQHHQKRFHEEIVQFILGNVIESVKKRASKNSCMKLVENGKRAGYFG